MQTHPTMQTQRAIPLYVLLLYTGLLVGVMGLHLKLLPYAYDDAYIHFRIADHLVRYGVPYFNPDEAVKASSSSAWTLFLAGVFLVWGASPAAVAILNGLLVTWGALVYAHLSAVLSRRPLHLVEYPFFLIGYLALTSRASIGLMETPLALLLLGGGIVLLSRRQAWGCACLAAAACVRVELAIFAVIFLLLALVEEFWHPALVLLATASGCVPFVWYDWHFFQTVLPNTVQAKALVYDISYAETLHNLTQFLAPTTTVWRMDLLWALLGCAGLLLLTCLVILHSGSRKQRAFGVYDVAFAYSLLLGGMLMAGAYIGARTFVFGWYVPLFTVPIFVALYTLARQSRSWVSLGLLGLLIVPLGADLGQTVFAASNNPAWYQEFATGARVRQYLQVGASLAEEYPGATLMTSEIGGLGYGFRGQVDDGAGLASPAALRYHPLRVPEERSVGHVAAIPVGYIEEVQPDIIVSYDIFIEAFLQSEVRQQYVQFTEPVYVADDIARSGQAMLWGSKYLNIFVRQDRVQSAASGR